MQASAASQGWNEANLALTDAKRQHYVPEFFLESFTGPDGNLRVVDLEDGRDFRTAPTNAAIQNYYNDFEVDGEILSTESWLSRLEGEASPILKQLIENPYKLTSLSIEEEFHLARFIAALRFRTPQYRAENEAIMASLVDQIRDLAKDQIFHQYGEKEGQALWVVYKDQPGYKWLGESEAPQPSRSSTYSQVK